MRVCFVSHSANRQGADRSLLETVRAVRKSGVECHVLAPVKGPLVEDVRKLGVSCTIWPYYWWVFKKSDPFWTRAMKGLFTVFWLGLLPLLCLRIRRLNFDLIYTNTAVTPVGGLIAFFLRKPHIWHLREFVEEDHGLRFFFGNRITGLLLNFLGTFFIANSRAVADKYRSSLPSGKLRVVYQAVEVEEEDVFSAGSNASLDRFRCVMVGRLQPSKGQEVAIRAVGNLVRRGFDVELRLVGDGEKGYRRKLEHLVRAEGISEHVRFYGFVPNPLPLVRESDVLLMCSVNEAFGRVTVEGMKAGLPVIGARSGGTTELITEGFNGLLYETGSYAELAEKIRYLAENRNVARQMGEAARKWADGTFTKKRYAREMMEIFEFVLRGRDS